MNNPALVLVNFLRGLEWVKNRVNREMLNALHIYGKIVAKFAKRMGEFLAIIHAHPVSEAFQVLASDWLKVLLGQSEAGKFTSFWNCFCKNQ